MQHSTWGKAGPVQAFIQMSETGRIKTAVQQTEGITHLQFRLISREGAVSLTTLKGMFFAVLHLVQALLTIADDYNCINE